MSHLKSVQDNKSMPLRSIYLNALLKNPPQPLQNTIPMSLSLPFSRSSLPLPLHPTATRRSNLPLQPSPQILIPLTSLRPISIPSTPPCRDDRFLLTHNPSRNAPVQTRQELRAPCQTDEPTHHGGQEHSWELREGELEGDEVGGGLVGEEEG